VSSTVLFLYDWMLTLPVELDVVWSEKLRPLRLLNVLYVIQRYMPFIDTIGILFAGKDDVLTVNFAKPIEPNTCRILYSIMAWMYLTGVVLSEAVLTMRTWALWGKDIRLTVGLTIFFVGCWVPGFYVAHLFVDSQIYIPSPLPQFGCVILGGESILFVCWVILMVLEYYSVRTRCSTPCFDISLLVYAVSLLDTVQLVLYHARRRLRAPSVGFHYPLR
ncbi:hypothetical protein BDP27DRAFT_1226530, partial [Rhodocollybia butyracea]